MPGNSETASLEDPPGILILSIRRVEKGRKSHSGVQLKGQVAYLGNNYMLRTAVLHE